MSRGLINRTLKKLSEKLSNTDWQTLNSYISYRKKNGFVIIKGYSSTTQATPSGINVGTLPVGYRPDQNLDSEGTALTAASHVMFRVYTDGNILVFATPSSIWSFTFIFPISGGVHRLFAVTPFREGAVA